MVDRGQLAKALKSGFLLDGRPLPAHLPGYFRSLANWPTGAFCASGSVTSVTIRRVTPWSRLGSRWYRPQGRSVRLQVYWPEPLPFPRLARPPA